MRVGLVGCVKGKRSSPVPARDLYTSRLFFGRRAYVERSCDAWYVLSALHGLVRPDQVLEPYDVTLNDAFVAARRAWSARVLRALEQELGTLAGHMFEIRAGRNYWAFGLVDGLLRAGADIEIPTEGLSLGQQLRFYRDHGF